MTATTVFNIFPDRPGELRVRCRLNEGTLTTASGEVFEGSTTVHSFVSGLSIGDKIVAYEVDSDGYIVVTGRAYTDERPIGEVVSKPKFQGVEPSVGSHSYGDYTREADILFYGQRIRTHTQYVAQSDNFTAGQFLKAAAHSGYENEVEESATETSMIGLDGITASTSAASHVSQAVLEGYELQTTDAS